MVSWWDPYGDTGLRGESSTPTKLWCPSRSSMRVTLEGNRQRMTVWSTVEARCNRFIRRIYNQTRPYTWPSSIWKSGYYITTVATVGNPAKSSLYLDPRLMRSCTCLMPAHREVTWGPGTCKKTFETTAIWPLLKSVQGIRYILVNMDYVAQYTEATPSVK